MTELPNGWERSTIGEICAEIRGSVTPAAGESYELYSVPIYPTGRPELLDGRAIGSAKRPVRPGDVLLCKINPRINRVWIVGEPLGFGSLIASTEYLVLRITEPMVGRFLRWYFQSTEFRRWIELSVEGATGSHTRAKSGPVMNQRVPLPPLAEQQRVVAAIEAHLSRLDAAEVSLRSALGRLHLHDRASVASVMVSTDWPWTTLGEIADVRGGVTKDAKKQGDPTFVEVPYLRVANVQRGRLDLTEMTRIRVDPAKADALRLLPGDLLLNEGGDRDKLGRGWVWEGQIDPCIHQNHVFRARLNEGGFDPYFVSTHANTWGQAWFETHGRQTTNLASISLSTLKQLPIPAPPLAEQQAIVAGLLAAREARERLDASLREALRRSASFRRSILATAFAGNLVPQDPEDEPASTLLERIRAEKVEAKSPRHARKAKAS